jgi:hypothetical protein
MHRRHLCLAVYCYIVVSVSGFTPLAAQQQTTTTKTRTRTTKVESNAELFAIPPPSGGSWGGGKRDKTAIESAVNVEWEPMTELDRRIEDGIHYEHDEHEQLSKFFKFPPKQSRRKSAMGGGEDIPVSRGVFYGYRYTPEEYNRLKSADPKD